VKLTTQLCLATKLRMGGAMSVLLCASVAWEGKSFRILSTMIFSVKFGGQS